MARKSVKQDPSKLRSRKWFANPDNPNMTALYLERYMNFGLKREELQAGKPIIGIAQSGSDLSPCNRHHLELAHRVREGIREAGGIAFEFPVHPIQETGKRPTAALDRNLCYLGLVETLYGYFIDGVVLTTGCDKTTPAQLMAAATVDIPAIVLSGGPMLNGWFRGERTGSGTIVWKARELSGSRRDQRRGIHRAHRLVSAVGGSLQHHGHGIDHELACRGAGHVAARLRGDPGAAQGSRGERLRIRQTHRRDGVGRPASLEDHDARSLRERDRRQLGDRRLDQRADPFQRDRPPHRRASSTTTTGRRSATTSRCW